MSIEDILGSPEEYRAQQVKADAEKQERLEKLTKQMHQHFQKREDECRAAFEAHVMENAKRYGDHPESLCGRMDGSGDYYNHWVQCGWEGWWAAMNQPHLRLDGMTIILPREEHQRFCALTDFNLILRCYMTQMVNSWKPEAAPRKYAMRAVEWMALHARTILTDAEYREICMLLVNTDTHVAIKRFATKERN